MDAIAIARQLGKAIQEDTRYKTVHEATAINDECQSLQQNITKFSELRNRMNEETAKPEKDNEKISKMDAELNELYDEIMNTPEMLSYSMAKGEMESFLGFINQIITGSANGQNPDLIEQEESCGEDCSSCSGCH